MKIAKENKPMAHFNDIPDIWTQFVFMLWTIQHFSLNLRQQWISLTNSCLLHSIVHVWRKNQTKTNNICSMLMMITRKCLWLNFWSLNDLPISNKKIQLARKNLKSFTGKISNSKTYKNTHEPGERNTKHLDLSLFLT